jgi:hypothetical protein
LSAYNHRVLCQCLRNILHIDPRPLSCHIHAGNSSSSHNSANLRDDKVAHAWSECRESKSKRNNKEFELLKAHLPLFRHFKHAIFDQQLIDFVRHLSTIISKNRQNFNSQRNSRDDSQRELLKAFAIELREKMLL